MFSVIRLRPPFDGVAVLRELHCQTALSLFLAAGPGQSGGAESQAAGRWRDRHRRRVEAVSVLRREEAKRPAVAAEVVKGIVEIEREVEVAHKAPPVRLPLVTQYVTL